MILPDQNLISTAELARELGCTPSAVCRWAHRPELAGCRWSRGLWLVSRLRSVGLLPALPPVPAAPLPIAPVARQGVA